MNFIQSLVFQCLWGLAFIASATAMPVLKVGVTAGPHFEILEYVSDLAKKQDLEVQIIQFNDFIIPNIALISREIDANIYQHLPFLQEQVKSRGFRIESVGKTILLPMGVYAKKIKTLDELKNNATVAIPNDPTNGSRALLLLQKLGLITLNPRASSPTILDITSNPKNLKFIELEATYIPRSLRDVDIALTNTDWILAAGMSPDKSIAKEDLDSPYVNLIVVRRSSVKDPNILKFVKIYQSQATKDFIKKRFKDAVIPAWE